MVSFPLAINLNNLNGRLFQVTCVYFSSMCTHMWPLCVLVEARGEHQLPQNLSYCFKLLCECRELNLGPLEEQQVLLTAEPSPQPASVP